MVRRVVIPAEDASGKQVAMHFGRAPYLAIFDVDGDETVDRQVAVNRSEHLGGRGHTHDNIMALRPDALIVYSMGPRGLSALEQAGVAVYRTILTETDQAVTAYVHGELAPLTEACAEPHGH